MDTHKIPHYDCIVVGSSPALLTEALYQSENGKKSVLIIEDQNCLGGAWGTMSLGDINDIEVGCHLIERSRKTYNFLIQNIGCSLVPLNPTPFKVKTTKHIAFDSLFISFLRLIKLVCISLFSYDPQQTPVEFKRTIRRFRSILLQSTFLYPPGGSKELICQFKRLFSKFNINHILTTPCKDLHINASNQVEIHIKNKQITCSKVILSSGSKIQTIKSSTNTFSVPQKTRYFPHIFLIISDDNHRISYVELVDHPLILRVSEFTQYASNCNNKRVISLALNTEKKWDEGNTDMASTLLSELHHLRILKPETSLIHYYWKIYNIMYHDQPTLDKISNQFSPAIETLHTVTLDGTFETHINRWKQRVHV